MDEFDSVQKEAGKLSTEIIIMNHVIWIEKLPNEQKRERKKNKRREFQEAFEEISPKPKNMLDMLQLHLWNSILLQ